MSWDSKSARRRQNSNAAGSSRALPSHIRQPSKLAYTTKSAHVTDPFLQDFLGPSFDPAEYWNRSLPVDARANQSTALPLTELSAQAQGTVSQLGAHTTRLTNTLTDLTDGILRSGSRLAYEVELLRGETLGLAESLTDGMRDDVVKFVPDGLGDGQDVVRRIAGADLAEGEAEDVVVEPTLPNEPTYITQLRTLTLVRARLDSVIKTFGDAMEFVFPPSEISVTSSFLSVSAPEPGSKSASTEDKGQQTLQALRDEIALLLTNAQDPVKGIEDAAHRIEELKELSLVWKGTAEEKGRARFLETLAKTVEDRHRELLREVEQQQARSTRTEQDEGVKRTSTEAATAERGYGGYGFMSQLQKIRGL